jgi:uncharacterized damage-inducible protein DinB
MAMAYIQKLFSYDDWANREVVKALQELKSPPARSLKWLSHILSAERLWLERLSLQPQTNPVWPDFTLEQCQLEAAELPRLWKSYLASLGDSGLANTSTYKNTKGESWSNQIEDILLHVVIHSAYHRGQIAADMRANGFTPAHTDFIHGIRQGLVSQGP